MSGNGEKAKPVSLAEDLDLSSESSSEDEAAVTVSPQEAAMDQGEVTPPAEPKPEPRAAATANTQEDRLPAEAAGTASTPTFPCAKCSYVGTSKGNLKTHVRRRHTDEDMMYQCTGCQIAYQRRDYLTRHQAAKPACRNAGHRKIPRATSRRRGGPLGPRRAPPCRHRPAK